MSDKQVQDKPTAAFVLSLIGGTIGLVVGLVFVGIAASMAGTYDFRYDYGSIRVAATIFGVIGAWSLITSIVVIISAVKLNSQPWEHTKWGVIILVFSIVGLGTLFGLIGGILALVYKPQAFQAPPPPVQAITRVCPKCGRVLKEETKFCPYCGHELEQ